MNQMNTTTKSIKSVQIKKEVIYLENRLKAYLADISICRENFTGEDVNDPNYPLVITKGETPIFEEGKKYLNGKIKLNSMTLAPIDATSFYFNFEYEKLGAGNLGSKIITKRLKISGEISPAGLVGDCYANDNNEISDLFDQAMLRVCNGPGVIGAPATQCTVVEQNLAATCLPGRTFKGYHYDAITDALVIECGDIISEFSNNANLPCPYGLKYTNTSGVFECFSLSDIVDTTPVVIPGDTNCQITMNGSHQIALSCL